MSIHKPHYLQGDRLRAVFLFALFPLVTGLDAVQKTDVQKTSNEWVLNGRKRWPGNAGWCDIIVVYASDTKDKQVKAFVVEKGTPGYSATKIQQKVALRMVQNADITLDNIRLSEEYRLQNCNSFVDVAKD